MDSIKEELNYFSAMLKKEYLIFSRYPILVVSTLLTPIFLVLIFSFTSKAFLTDPSEEEIQVLASFMFIGILAYSFLEMTTSASVAVREEQFYGTLESLFLTPATKVTNLIARMTVRVIFVSFNALVIYIVLTFSLAEIKFDNVSLGIFLFMMLVVQFVGYGLILATLTLKLKETGVIISNFSIFIIMIFSAIFFSFSTISYPLLLVFSKILPSSYTVDAIRSTLLGYPPGFPELLGIELEIIISVLSAIGLVLFGIWWYLRVEKEARRTGSLLQY